jgi:hypothetical protein
VTLDYLMLVLAWQLDMRDLKKLSLNGIDYSSLEGDMKNKTKEVFNPQWEAFIKKVAAQAE